jgi:hypothetical protein
MTREQYAVRFLHQVGAKATRRNLLALVAWMQAEGGSASWNPLNTTQEAPGATVYNYAGVKNYPSAQVGIQAASETLNYGARNRVRGYGRIRHRLRKNKGAMGTLLAVERSDWGTGGLAVKVLAMFKTYLNYRKYANVRVAE